jgi:hypothetical protein
MVLDPDVMVCPPASPRQLRQMLAAEIARAIVQLDTLDGEAEDEAETGVNQDENPVSLNPRGQRPTKRIGARRRYRCASSSTGGSFGEPSITR